MQPEGTQASGSTGERRSFQAEVSRLLDIVAHSLYSEKEIFLRELISNASDACDRMRYAALTQPELTAGGDETGYRITLAVDKTRRTLTIADNGIGMGHDELVENLGTIARSGTAQFLEKLTGDARKDVALIGQFGVGFYSAFMVAERVEVLSRRAGEEKAWLWISDGKGEFTVAPAEKAARGCLITLHLRGGEDEYLEQARLAGIVKKYSDHIAVPILFQEDGKETALNAASALWTRPRSEISAEQYKEFYHHVAHAFDEPWLTAHWRAEGTIAYSCLLFVPTSKPFDLFHPDRKHRVKLYVRRVFITDQAENLVPAYLRFLRGVVDSEDLPLNVSREMLQSNPTLAKIRSGITKRVLADLARKAEAEPAAFETFWTDFGAVLKEGLYDDRDQREVLLKLVRLRSTLGDGWTTLADYVGRMKEGQDEIFYITGDDLDALKASPQLEGFTRKGIEVLLLTDPIDEFWMPAVGDCQGKKFRSATQGGIDLGRIKGAEPPDGKAEEKKDEGKAGRTDALIAMIKLSLGDLVKDVRSSQRLTDSAVCLVAAEGDLDMRLERMLRQHKQIDRDVSRVLEVNPDHPLIRRLADLVAEKGASGGAGAMVEDAAHLLLDQARIIEGVPVPDPRAFARRMASVMEKGLSV